MAIGVWRSPPGYEGLYLVSTTGLVKSLMSNKILKPNHMNNGYLSVELFRNKKSKRFLIHRLVAQTFLPNPDNLPYVNHKDENKQNNTIDNLEWCTRSYNVNYGTANERRRTHWHATKKVVRVWEENKIKNGKPVLCYTKKGEFIKRFNSAKEAGAELKTTYSHICDVCNGKRKSAAGYIFKYESEVIL